MTARTAKRRPDRPDRLAGPPDDQINTTDIPEAGPERWRYARRPGRGEYRVQPVAIDGRVVAWFRENYGDDFEEAMNEALREHIRKAIKAKTKPA